jgi:hypothetical protein
MTRAKTESVPEVPEYPAWWDWDSDGKSIEGAFVRAGTGYTQMGPRPFVVLDHEGDERTVWLHHDVLRNLFAREVHRRPDKMIHRDETVRIWQLEARESQSNAGRSYTDYRVEFPEGPESTQVDIFGPPPEGSSQPQPETEGTAVGSGVSGDDIPFA